MRNLTKLTMFIALTALGMASPVLLANAQAAVIFSDDFEADTFGLNTGLINWTVTDGTIDVVGPSAFGINCGGSTKCVDLDGSSGSAGRIETELLSLSLVGSHSLSFDLSGNQRGGSSDTVQVFIGAMLLDTITLAPGAPFSTHTLLFIPSATNARIIFDHAGGDNVGLILDNVLLQRLDPNPTGVPEPMTLGLLGAGLFGIGALRRRRG